MNWNRVEGCWKQFTGSAKVKWGEFTEARLDKVAGKREQEAGRVQETAGDAQEAQEGRDARAAAPAKDPQ
jgi:uncharacterized protein YjbJ (UPF0337 family)